MDSLRRRVLARDARNNTARQMEVTARGPETHRICLQCRQIPIRRFASRPTCRHCGGQIIEVTW